MLHPPVKIIIIKFSNYCYFVNYNNMVKIVVRLCYIIYQLGNVQNKFDLRFGTRHRFVVPLYFEVRSYI